jgi:CRP/FNR family transcriptional regulator, cyclic AMP receptor protein
MTQTYEMLKAHPFLTGLIPYELALLVDCGNPVQFAANERIFEERREARSFWLIGEGRVRLDTIVPGHDPVIVETLGPGTVLGWSWLAPPYRWHFGALAVETTTALHMDGPSVRDLCERFPALGYRLMDRFAQVVVDRLQNTRIRLLDRYGTPR